MDEYQYYSPVKLSIKNDLILHGHWSILMSLLSQQRQKHYKSIKFLSLKSKMEKFLQLNLTKV